LKAKGFLVNKKLRWTQTLLFLEELHFLQLASCVQTEYGV